MAKLTDMYDQDEIPTMPGTPVASARRCKFCGLVYGEHSQTRRPQNSSGCQGVRMYFEPEKNSDGDRTR